MLGSSWLSSEEREIQACTVCKGPFEYWGASRGFSLYRCKTCKLIHFVEIGNLANFEGQVSKVEVSSESSGARADYPDMVIGGMAPDVEQEPEAVPLAELEKTS